MSYGIPYMGSKNIYAAKILEVLPPGKRLIDLFAGGCAITDCAIRKFPGKWETVLANDIDERPLNLYKSCLMGAVPVSEEWVSREEFASADWATRLVWSFGYNCRDYLYGKNIEERKRNLHEWVLTGEGSSELPRIMDMDGRCNFVKANEKQTLETSGRWAALSALNHCTIHARLNASSFHTCRFGDMNTKKEMLFTATFHTKTHVAINTLSHLTMKNSGNGRENSPMMCMYLKGAFQICGISLGLG